MDKVTRQCPQTTAFLRRKESRSGIKPGSFSLTPYRWAKPAHATRRLQRAINKANGFPDRSATIAGNPIHCPTVTSPLSPRSLARCHVTTLSPLAGPLSRHHSLPARWPAVTSPLSPPSLARCHVTTLSPPAVTSPLSPPSLAHCHVTTLSPPAGLLSRHHSLPARWPAVTSQLSPRPLARCHVTTLSPPSGPLSRHHSLPARWPAVSVCGPCQQRLDRFRSVLRSERERGPFCGQRTTTAGLPGTG